MMKKIASIMVLALVLGLAIAANPVLGQDSFDSEILSVAKSDLTVERVRTLDLDLLMERGGRVYIVASPADLRNIGEAGIPYRLETERLAPAFSAGLAAQGDINGAFHSYYEVENELKALESSYPALAKVMDLGQSLELRHIYALKVSANVQLDEDEAKVLILGCHHAREWISVEVPLLMGKYLLEHYATDAGIKGLVDKSEVWIVPLVNPDGLEYSIHYWRYWRKNRRDNGDNSWGVDLNRNYGYAWGWDVIGSSPNPTSDVYRGKAPFSEPEVQAIRDLVATRRFQGLISYHNYSQVILYPWGFIPTPAPDDSDLEALAAGMAGQIVKVNGRVYDYGPAGATLYLTNGDTTDWAYGTYGIPAYTIELPPLEYVAGGFFNPESDIDSIFRENVPAMTYLIDQSIKGFIPASDGQSRVRPPKPPPTGPIKN